jgi:cytochrome d ubiquinol oxidase subunit II
MTALSVGAFGPPELVAALVLVALNAYVLMGGADFGGGVWDLLASGPRRDEQREAIASVIAPIWEANHVWLIIAVVVAFTAFPAPFAAVLTVLHIPVALMLIGIVLRGSAFVFRRYGSRSGEARKRWGRTFAIASTISPLLLGAIIGAVATGAVGAAHESVSTSSFVDVFVASWLAPFPVSIGLLTLTLFAQLAATYLTVSAPTAVLREDFRSRALGSAVAVLLAAAATLLLIPAGAPFMRVWLLAAPWSLVLFAGTGAVALAAVVALWRRSFVFARAAVAAEVSLILWGWAAAQYPYVLPPSMTIRAAAAPAGTLDFLLWALAGGALILVPSLAYLLRTFAAQERQ